MKSIRCDASGRLFLREALRRRYGDRFVVIPTADELVLVPVPTDPVAALRDATKPLRGSTLKKLRSEIEAEAARQVAR